MTDSSWNGPICNRCGTRYLGYHTCSREDILRKVQELLSLLGCPGCGQQIDGAHFCPGPQAQDNYDQTRDCGCRPENGGSGVCGCILSGIKITC